MVIPATLTVSRCGANAKCAVGLSGRERSDDIRAADFDVLQGHLRPEDAKKIGDVFAHGLFAV